MKCRNGFVSNSSSSSFIISLDRLNSVQQALLQKHGEVCCLLADVLRPPDELDDLPWDVEIIGDTIHGTTDMDNFDMHYFMRCIGIPMSKVGWRRYQSEEWEYED